MRAKCAYYWQKMRLTYLSHFITRQSKILYCQYVVVHGRYTHVDLFLRTNHNYKERIHLNDYFCNHRELRAAIAFYSRGKVELESKEEF